MKKGTKWMKKNCIGLHVKVDKEDWQEADKETKEAAHAKLVDIIADKQKSSSASTQGTKQFHE